MYVTYNAPENPEISSEWKAVIPDVIFLDFSPSITLQMPIEEARQLVAATQRALDERDEWHSALYELAGNPGTGGTVHDADYPMGH